MMLAILSLAMASPTSVLFRDRVELKGGNITLGAVADLSALPGEMRSQAMNLVLLRLRPDSRGMTVSHVWLASRARALMPAIAAWMPSPKDGAVMINAEAFRYGQAVTNCGDGVSKGADVTISVEAGWFRVERKAVAVQDGKAGGRFFVRTSDRQVVPVFCMGSE